MAGKKKGKKKKGKEKKRKRSGSVRLRVSVVTESGDPVAGCTAQAWAGEAPHGEPRVLDEENVLDLAETKGEGRLEVSGLDAEGRPFVGRLACPRGFRRSGEVAFVLLPGPAPEASGTG